jgi:hypothetical protein
MSLAPQDIGATAMRQQCLCNIGNRITQDALMSNIRSPLFVFAEHARFQTCKCALYAAGFFSFLSWLVRVLLIAFSLSLC